MKKHKHLIAGKKLTISNFTKYKKNNNQILEYLQIKNKKNSTVAQNLFFLIKFNLNKSLN